DAEKEWARLQRAVEQTGAQLLATGAVLNARGYTDEAGIFEAQRLMVGDAALLEPARNAIFESWLNAAAAFGRAAEAVAARYDTLSDAYLRARAADVRGAARLVLQDLLGAAPPAPFEAGILVAAELTPAATAQLDPETVQAICTAYGAPTGHSAIVAKSLGIPAVVGLGDAILEIHEGQMLLADGERGRVWMNPSQARVQEYRRQQDAAREVAEEARRARLEPAVTRDGRRVEIAA